VSGTHTVVASTTMKRGAGAKAGRISTGAKATRRSSPRRRWRAAAEALDRRNWHLSEEAEGALKRLGQAGCDPGRLRVMVLGRRDTPLPLDRRKVHRLLIQTKQMEDAVTALSQTFTGIWIAPPVSGQTTLGRLTADLRGLRTALAAWLKRRRTQDVIKDFSLAAVCAYVGKTTGKPHDQDIAELWDRPSAEAVRRFRKEHANLIRLFHAISAERFLAAPPPNPNTTS
jgi:hypothetical protein